jgi:hypothetical protein
MVDARQTAFGFTRRCPNTRSSFEWRQLRTGALHLGLFCVACGAWQGWVPQSRTMLALAPPKPEVRA